MVWHGYRGVSNVGVANLHCARLVHSDTVIRFPGELVQGSSGTSVY